MVASTANPVRVAASTEECRGVAFGRELAAEPHGHPLAHLAKRGEDAQLYRLAGLVGARLPHRLERVGGVAGCEAQGGCARLADAVEPEHAPVIALEVEGMQVPASVRRCR